MGCDVKTAKPGRVPFKVPAEWLGDAPEKAAIRSRHKYADRLDTIAKCYFIGADKGPVKIGYSANVEARRQHLQLHCPLPLKVLALARGGLDREAAYHYQFRAHRLHGEWFERCPEIESEIARLNKAQEIDDA